MAAISGFAKSQQGIQFLSFHAFALFRRIASFRPGWSVRIMKALTHVGDAPSRTCIGLFLIAAGAAFAFDCFLAELRATVIAYAARFPRIGRRYLGNLPQLAEALAQLRALPEWRSQGFARVPAWSTFRRIEGARRKRVKRRSFV